LSGELRASSCEFGNEEGATWVAPFAFGGELEQLPVNALAG